MYCIYIKGGDSDDGMSDYDVTEETDDVTMDYDENSDQEDGEDSGSDQGSLLGKQNNAGFKIHVFLS